MITNATLSQRPFWGRATLLVGFVHAAAIGALFLRFSTVAEPSSEMPAIAVEMASPAALPSPVRDAPTPLQIEAPKQMVKELPQPKKLPFDPPPQLQVADARPEVLLPLKKEELPHTEKLNPLPPAPTTTEQAAPDLKPDTRTTALNTGGASAGEASAADRWDARVLARIEMTKRYPQLAVQNNQQDEVQLVLTIDRTGRLRDAQIAASRGFTLLNDAALDAVRRASPFQEPPKEVEGDPIRISVIVRFVKALSRN